jgi:hypothetical protein
LKVTTTCPPRHVLAAKSASPLPDVHRDAGVYKGSMKNSFIVPPGVAGASITLRLGVQMRQVQAFIDDFGHIPREDVGLRF